MTDLLGELSGIGVSIWLDDLSRGRLRSGGLRDLVDHDHVVGVTTNPSIFRAAIADGRDYSDQIAELAARGTGVDEAVRAMTTDDVRSACDVLRPVYDATGGRDGRVSIEVDPRLAHQTEESVDQAVELARIVDRPNVMIKIPSTPEGLPAISRVLGGGISVNATLIFSPDQYRQVLDAWLYGLEQAQRIGVDLSVLHSVASVFVSRVDTAVDTLIDASADPALRALRCLAGVAGARLCYQAYLEVMELPRWKALEALGAHPQRPLWASTGVKDPTLPATYYVQELAAPGTVDTMPEKTLRAAAAGAELRGDAVTGTFAQARDVMERLAAAGIDMDAVHDLLLSEGVEKFESAWRELLSAVEGALRAAH